MPTYEYQCQNHQCGAACAADQGISEPPLIVCADCKQPTLKRLISSGGTFVLKGPRWFKSGGY